MSAAQRRIRISRGNVKLGRVESVSHTPVIGCVPDVPCTLECYAVATLRGRYRARIAAAWTANLDYLQHDRRGYFNELRDHLRRRLPKLFRYHIGGDWLDLDHLQRAIILAGNLPAVRFLAFSKAFDIFPTAGSLPDNFTLIASGWVGWKDPPAGYRVAWMRDPDDLDPRIPAAALECPGGCDTCGLCWHLPTIGADVVFEKH